MTEDNNNDLTPLKMIGPLPLFWGEETDSMERIEAEGYNDYYIVGLEKYETVGENKVTKVAHRPVVFRVSKTVVGRAVVVADPAEIDVYSTTRHGAEWSMPKMPWALVEKMDQFFRRVYKKLGTESILILTYDPAFFESEDPSQGWNCVAPDQKNTAGHCEYDPPSVQKYKTEEEIIVGTIHSHPNMSAFFSSTDHKDQDDWDGIHITEAWKGDGPTEYYIALVLGGEMWTLRPEQVFANPPLPTIDTTPVDGWIERVEKKETQTTSYGSTTYGGGHTPGRTSSQSLPIPLTSQSMKPGVKARALKLPEGAPDPSKAVIIAEYPAEITLAASGSHKCRMCKAPLLTRNIDARRCIACSSFIILDDESLADLVDYRAAGQFPYSLEIDPEKTQYNIFVWKVDGEFQLAHQLEGALPDPK